MSKMKNKVIDEMNKNLIECHRCGYMWESKSKKIMVTCPNCLRKTKKLNSHKTL